MSTAAWLALATCAAVLGLSALASVLWVGLAFVPLVNLIAIPSLIGSLLLLIHTLPFATYLLLAQEDAPRYRAGLFLPFSPARHLGVLVAVSSYILFVGSTAPAWAVAVVRTAWRLWNAPAAESCPRWWSKFASFGIAYREPNGPRLDVYRAQPRVALERSSDDSPLSRVSSCATLPDVDNGRAEEFPAFASLPPGSPRETQDSTLRPVLVFLYDVGTMGPARPRRWMYGLTGVKLAEQGYVAVVPDITMYPQGSMEESVADVRAALAWVHKEIRSFGGDPNAIYLVGHGLGAHLGMYTLAQDSVVASRQRIEIHNAAISISQTHAESAREIPNGVKQLRVYGGEIELPRVRGCILLSPVADIIKQVRHESKCWLEHVSPLRRSLGSTQTRCMKHSLGHILFAAKDLIDTDELPGRALVIHGNKDLLVPSWQAVWLTELLRGLDMRTTLREYSRLAHFDVVTSLMAGLETRTTEWLLHDIRSFVGA